VCVRVCVYVFVCVHMYVHTYAFADICLYARVVYVCVRYYLYLYQYFLTFSKSITVQYNVVSMLSSFLLVIVSQTKRGKAGDKKGDGKINNKIIVDVREFRSSLPSLIHAAGNSYDGDGDGDDDDGVDRIME
jgi:hypothetical protein